MKILRHAIFAIVCFLVAAGAAFGADVQWTNTAVSAGDFNTAANWLNGTMPGASDKITWYGYSGPPASLNIYSVTLTVSADHTFSGWDQDYWNNEVNVNLNGNKLTGLGGFWGVWTYGASGIGVTNRIYGGGTLNTWQLNVGGAQASATSPLFEIYGAGTVVTTTTGMAAFGNNTRAFIRDGARLITGGDNWATAQIGQGASLNTDAKNAVVILSNARWDNEGLLCVGQVKGDGTFIVTNGAVYSGTRNVNLGGWQYVYEPITDYKNKGTIRVTGSGSSFETTLGRADVGLLSTGRVESVKGGSFQAPSMRLGVGYSDWEAGNVSSYGGTNFYAYGSALADELGVIAVRGDLTVGVLGKGDVTASNNGEIYVGNNLDVNTDGRVTVSDGYISAGTAEMSGSLLRLELGAKDQTAYYLAVSGGLMLSDVDLEIDLLGNFSAALNDEIKLISFGSLDGGFNGWSDGTTFTRDIYEFTYNETGSDAYLTVTAIPEPASALLMLSGLVAAWKLRRRA